MSCCNRIEATNVTVVAGTSVTITFIPTQQFFDKRCYEFCLPMHLPPITGTERVFLTDGTTTYYVLDCAADLVYAGQLRGHRKYRIKFGANGLVDPATVSALHFIFLEGLCCMKYTGTVVALEEEDATVTP